jgi:hypothetical protein
MEKVHKNDTSNNKPSSKSFSIYRILTFHYIVIRKYLHSVAATSFGHLCYYQVYLGVYGSAVKYIEMWQWRNDFLKETGFFVSSWNKIIVIEKFIVEFDVCFSVHFLSLIKSIPTNAQCTVLMPTPTDSHNREQDMIF